MDSEEKSLEEGWGFPALSKKAHYFVNSMSLCRSWMYGGTLESGNDNSPDNCKRCIKLKKERKGDEVNG